MTYLDAHAHADRRQPEIDALIASNLLGLRLVDHHRHNGMHQNFAVLRPTSAISSRLFIHGRELFSREAAAHYFSLPDTDKTPFAYSEFSDAAKQKIRAYLSCDALPSRLYDYDGAVDEIQSFHLFLAYIKKHFPKVILPPFSPPTDENVYNQRAIITECLENQGVDIGAMWREVLFPTPENLARLREERQALTRKELAAALDTDKHHGKAQCAAWEAALNAELCAHDWDPEIIRNFVAGMDAGAKPQAPLQDIIALGIEARTEKLLRKAASTMRNPYSIVFSKFEQQTASAIVHAVQPRILRKVTRHKTPILITDDQGLRSFYDILGYADTTWQTAAGSYSSKEPATSTANDFIILRFRGSSPSNARFIRHEFEHHRDLTRRMPFAGSEPNIEEMIRGDLRSVMGTSFILAKKDLRLMTNAQRQRLQQLAELRGYDVSNEAKEHTALIKLQDDLEEINNQCASFMALGNGSKYYTTKLSQHNEIPAVLAQLKGEYGAPFIRELLPNLYEAFIRQRLSDAELRDIPPQGCAR